MTKQLMLGAAIGALMISGALAQAPNTAPGSTPPSASSATVPAGSTAAGKAEFISAQKPDQLLASKFKGTDVLGSDNQKVGDISDIVFDKTGKIEAYVVSVGGFLGMGAKEVALAPSAFEVVPGDNGGAPKLKTAMTKDELKAAQNFARYEATRPAATTGAGGGLGGARPSSGGMAPAGR